MSIKIYKFNKDLTYIAEKDMDLSDSVGMAISHYFDATKSTEATIPFSIEGSSKHIPYIKDVEFCIAVRKKVNLIATGPNSSIIKENGSDIGKYNYVDNKPSVPNDIPGFTELYKRE